MTTRAKAMERALAKSLRYGHRDDCQPPWDATSCNCGLHDARVALALPPDPDQSAEIARLTAALRTIAGYEQCIDPLMGNVDIARRALEEKP